MVVGEVAARPLPVNVGAEGLGEEVVVGVADAATLGSGVAPEVVGVDGPGGDVARGGGQAGSKESANNFRSCDSA